MWWFHVHYNRAEAATWWLYADNNKRVAWVGETFASLSNARQAASAVKAAARSARYDVCRDAAGTWRWRAWRGSDRVHRRANPSPASMPLSARRPTCAITPATHEGSRQPDLRSSGRRGMGTWSLPLRYSVVAKGLSSRPCKVGQAGLLGVPSNRPPAPGRLAATPRSAGAENAARGSDERHRRSGATTSVVAGSAAASMFAAIVMRGVGAFAPFGHTGDGIMGA